MSTPAPAPATSGFGPHVLVQGAIYCDWRKKKKRCLQAARKGSRFWLLPRVGSFFSRLLKETPTFYVVREQMRQTSAAD
jgi:hypothetical protein